MVKAYKDFFGEIKVELWILILSLGVSIYISLWVLPFVSFEDISCSARGKGCGSFSGLILGVAVLASLGSIYSIVKKWSN